jgi:hypothetical protein
MDEFRSDVTFIVEGQRVPALKDVLAVKSEVFRAMFWGDFVESSDKEVVIKDTTHEAFKVMIRFLYTDQLVLNNENDWKLIGDVIALADRHELNRLMARVSAHLKTRITADNLEFVAKTAFLYENQKLIESVKTFVVNNFDELLVRPKEELNRMDAAVNQLLFEMTVKKYLKVKTYFEGKMPTHDTSCYNPVAVYINGHEFVCRSSGSYGSEMGVNFD